jgi:GAF domain-containing protein
LGSVGKVNLHYNKANSPRFGGSERMKPSLTRDGKPVLDEATFQKLLEAAYVVQEHTDRVVPGLAPQPEPERALSVSDSTTTLAEIVETQHQIHTDRLNLDSSSQLVVDRIRKITGAQGAAIGILEEEKLVYRAGSGILASQVRTALRPDATLSSTTLLHDAILRCPDADADFRVNPEIAKRMGIRSLISVPVFHDSKTAGVLELVFTSASAFQEQDVRTCQLMAGLVTEALTHAAEEEWRKGVTAERASMLEVLEKIKPQLARLAQEPKSSPAEEPLPPDLLESLSDQSKCQHCGAELAAGEVFCGSCGTSRSTVARNDLQSKWATLWNLKKATGQATGNPGTELESSAPPLHDVSEPTPSVSDSEEYALPDFILPEKKVPATPPAPPLVPTEAPAPPSEFLAIPQLPDQGSPLLPVKTEEEQKPAENLPVTVPVPVQKPAEPRVWFRSIAVSPPALQLKSFWQKHRGFLRRHPGDLALGAAAILFAITIIWSISSNNPTTSANSTNTPQTAATSSTPAKPKRKAPPPPPKLSLFEQFLVSMGLAEPPAAPSYTGNPNVPVWVDVHTALYYCPGSEQYGKTPQGKIASQHDAQLDQFEPASRKVCD